MFLPEGSPHFASFFCFLLGRWRAGEAGLDMDSADGETVASATKPPSVLLVAPDRGRLDLHLSLARLPEGGLESGGLVAREESPRYLQYCAPYSTSYRRAKAGPVNGRTVGRPQDRPAHPAAASLVLRFGHQTSRVTIPVGRYRGKGYLI